MSEITIKVTGIDKIIAALDRYPREIAIYLGQAGNEAAENIILKTEGLRSYPPSTSANQPPTPYYVRGRGMQYMSGNKLNSERLGTQFYVQNRDLSTIIGNRASYAKYVVGNEQAWFMKPKGWRILHEVAYSKIKEITDVYNRWVKKLLQDLGLG